MFQKKEGIKDNNELFIKDMMDVGHGLADPELVKAFVENSKTELEWMTTTSGMSPIKIMVNSGMSVPRSHRFDSSKLTMFYYNYAKEHGAKIETNAKAEHRIWDNDKRKIIGVVVSRKGKDPVNVKSKLGVLITTGGFARNPELLAKYSPKSKNAAAISGVGTTGDGLLIAQEYGADVTDVTFAKPTYGFTLTPKTVQDKSSVF